MSGPTEGNLNATSPAAPSGKQNSVFQASSAYTDPLTGLPERDISCYPPSAAANLEGAIAIAGDVGGTSTTPKVVGIQGVGISATSPTNGQVLEYNSGSGLWVPTASGGPGGASAPYNDMISPATVVGPPNPSTLTWGNQSGASASLNAGSALYMSAPAGSGSNNNIFLYKSAPGSTPWTFTIGFQFGMTQGFGTFFLGLRESATGKLITFSFGNNGAGGNAPNWGIFKWTNYTTFSANYIGATSVWVTAVTWVAVTYDGTNIIWQSAVDGQNLKTLLSKSKTDFFTSGADQVGVGLDNVSASNPTDAVVVHWTGI